MAWTRDQMAARAAKELKDGFYVNLGIRHPDAGGRTTSPRGWSAQLQSENGMLGMGPFPFEGEEDPDLINAGKETVTPSPTTGSSRPPTRSHDPRRPRRPCILGAMQVSRERRPR